MNWLIRLLKIKRRVITYHSYSFDLRKQIDQRISDYYRLIERHNRMKKVLFTKSIVPWPHTNFIQRKKRNAEKFEMFILEKIQILEDLKSLEKNYN